MGLPGSVVHTFRWAMMILSVASAGLAAQGNRNAIDVSAGPVLRDARFIGSTNRWGGQLRLGFGGPTSDHVAFRIAATATAFGGPGNAVTATGSATSPESHAIGGFGALGVGGEVRWYAATSQSGPYGGAGLGAVWLAPGNMGKQWRAVAAAHLGYSRPLDTTRAVFAEMRYERILGMSGSPQWLVPLLLGVKWSVGSPSR